MQVAPQNATGHVPAGVEQMMVVVPVDADVHETQHVTEKDREQRAERVELAPMRRPHFEHHDGDDDGDHAVAEGLEPGLSHASIPKDQLPTPNHPQLPASNSE